VAVLAAQQQLRHETVLDHGRCAPLGGDEHVAGQVPPEVVREVLVPAVAFPRAAYLEGGVVQDRDAVRAAGHGVRPGVAGLAGQFLGRDLLDQDGVARIVLGVEHVDPRRPQAGHDEIPALHVRVRRGRAQGAAARVPAEVVQLVAGVRQVGPADHAAVRGGGRIGVHDV
jgi:hypothetical protein